MADRAIAAGSGITFTGTSPAALTINADYLGATNLQEFPVRKYGAVGNGSTNDTTAIQAAIDAAFAAGGGRVTFDAGTFVASRLYIKNRVWLQGAGMRTTKLLQLAGTNNDFIQNYVSSNGTSDPNGQFIAILDLWIDGNITNQTSGRGIYLTQNPAFGQPAGDDMTDPRALIQNVMIHRVKGNAFEEANGRSETRLINVHAFYCGGMGFRLGPDSNLIGCVAGAVGAQGFYISRSSIRMTNCKAFYCGDAVGGGDGTLGIGYHLTGARGVHISNCEAQDCKAEGLIVENYSWNNRIDMILDSNSKRGAGLHAAMKLGPGYRNDINIVAYERNDPADGVFAQQNALDIVTAEDAHSNRINITHGSGASGVTVGTAIKPATNTAALVARNTITVNSQGAFRAPSYAASYTPDPYQATTHAITLTGNITIAATTNHHAGAELTFVFTQDGTGGRTVTWNAQYVVDWAPNTGANKVNSITFVYNGTSWVHKAVSTNAATGGTANTQTLVWTGSAYPTKTATYAVYQGPTEPSGMVDGDIWIDTDAVTPAALKSVVMLGSDVTNNNASANTIADVTGLSFPVASGVRYAFRFVIFYTAAATTTGSRWSINGPTATALYYNSQYSATQTTKTSNEGLSAYDSPSGANASSAQTGSNMAIVEGYILPSATGNVIARFASEVASSAIVAKAGSYVEVTRLS